ncbi:right-handed parallel beta-helix repeat-containing protein, partial [bacterium]|nr:right-handed parallel beta-helix repeat-containing protein [bacterium]
MKFFLSSFLLLFLLCCCVYSYDCEDTSPCDIEYWECLNDDWSVAVDVSYCPLTYQIAEEVPSTLKQDGNLLLTNNFLEASVFLRGVGEYNEVYEKEVFNDTRIEDCMDLLQQSGLNMVRVFVSSGRSLVIPEYPEPNPLDAYSFPFMYSNVDGRAEYHLHKYNESYFDHLSYFINQAHSKNITVMLVLFDFAGDISWSEDAWNPDNNDHATLAGFTLAPSPPIPGEKYLNTHKTEMHNIWDDTNLTHYNQLGLTQRDFVLKVVREVRDHPNVVIEIANEPKDVDMSKVVPWVQEVANWIVSGYDGLDCDGAPAHLRAVTMPKEYDQPVPTEHTTQTPTPTPHGGILNRNLFLTYINTPLYTPTPSPTVLFGTGTPTYTPLPKQLINIYAEHNAYLGCYTSPTDPYVFSKYDETYSCSVWERINLTLNRQSDVMDEDLSELTNYSLVLLCDTDGLHRRMLGTTGNNVPFGRDFDSNCRRFANIASIKRAHFNTKEQLHWDHPSETTTFEQDCVCYSPGLHANEDDFLGDNNWDDFDVKLGDAVCALDNFIPSYSANSTPTPMPPLNYRHLTRSAGFYPPVVTVIDDDDPSIVMMMMVALSDNYRLFENCSTFFSGYIPILPNSSYYGSIAELPFDTSSPIIPNGGALNWFEDSNFFHTNISGFTNVYGNIYILTSLLYGPVSHPVELVIDSICLSDPWPMLYSSVDHINQDSGVFTAPTPISGSDIPLRLHNLNIQSKTKQIKPISQHPRTRRISCFDPPPSGSDPDPVSIVLAGWGFSNLHSICPGYLELELAIYDPRASLDGTSITGNSFDRLNIRCFGSSNWSTAYTFDDFSTTKFNAVSGANGGLWLFTKLIFPLNEAVEDGFSLFELALFDPFELKSTIWPQIKVIHQLPTSYYIDTRIEKDKVGKGLLEDPYSSFSYALSQITEEGTLSHPCELILVSGTHTIDEKTAIVLGDYMNLSGENGAIIQYAGGTSSGYFIEMGRHSKISNLTLGCGVLVEHSHTQIVDCIFQNIDNNAAIKLTGFHDLTVQNSILKECELAILAEDDSVLKIIDSNIVACDYGIKLQDEALGNIANSIFFNIEDPHIFETGIALFIDDDSEAVVKNCGFFQNEMDLSDSSSNSIASFECLFGSDPGTPDSPEFIDWTNGDFHLVQSTVRNMVSQTATSPCVNAGVLRFYNKGTTSILGERDSGQYDIGYHYPETEFEYNFPRFKADDGVSTDYTSRIAIHNPTEYTQSLSLSCYNMAGSLLDFNGSADGKALEIQIEAGHTWYRVLTDSCTPGDDECIEAPCSDGSITVISDGPLFGQYRIVEESTSTGVNSWMFQMQRTDLADNDGGITTLSCDTFVTSFGGYNTIESEIILHNLSDDTTTVAGTVYNHLGTPIPSDSFTEILDAHETKSLTFDSSSTVDYGNMEINASAPITGELIYHCQNVNSDRRFSEGVIMVPSTLNSDTLTAPFLLIENYGSHYQESYICLKNPNNNTVLVNVNVFDENGNSIYTGGTPTPTPMPIPPHGSDCLSSYNFPDWGSYSVEFDVIGDDKIIGHNEIVLYDTAFDDLSMSGCELDHHIAMPNRYFVPHCALNDEVGQEYETTWIGLRNNNPTASVSVDLTIFDFDGIPLDGTTITLGSRQVLLFN